MGRVKRVPVVMQMEALECGAASLGMVLAYWKKWLPLERLRIDCGVSRDGSNALNILKAARKYGMVAKGFRMEVERLRKVEDPAILHWNFCHFVVFNGFKGDKVSLNDPARGRVLVDMEEFNRSFTGIVLTFQPGPEFKSSGRRASVLSFVCERMKSAKAALLFTFLTGLLMAFVGLISPVFSQIFMDDILSGKNPDWFPFFIGMYAAWKTANIMWGKGILDAIFTLPMVLPPTVTGFFLLIVFGKSSTIGKFLAEIDFDMIFSWRGAVLASVVVTFPLMYRTTRSAFEQLNPNLIDAGRTLGLSEIRIF